MPTVAPAILTVPAKTGDLAYYEAKWWDRNGKQRKRRLGRAWLERDPQTQEWRPRRGRTPDGWLDERTVHVAAAAKVREVEAEERSAAEAAEKADIVTFRRVAREWLEWKRDVKGASPATLRGNESMLAEPGTPHRRGRGTCEGRIMKRFGDDPIREIPVKKVARFLSDLDREGLTPRNVNAHRSILHAIFNYAMKPTTYELKVNPVTGTDVRYEPPPPSLDYYEVHEVEALACSCEQGKQRASTPHYKGRPSLLSADELAARAREDQQDADLFRVKFYGGLRLGEVLAVRIRDVQLLPDLSGAFIWVERAVSAGEEKTPKSGRPRPVPLPRAAAEALARNVTRDEFTGPDDYVFCGRLGERLDGSALRRRFKRAIKAVGLRPMKLHGLRHAAGSVLARTLPLVAVRDVLGHAKLSTTNRYLHSKIDLTAITAVNSAFEPPSEQLAA